MNEEKFSKFIYDLEAEHYIESTVVWDNGENETVVEIKRPLRNTNLIVKFNYVTNEVIFYIRERFAGSRYNVAEIYATDFDYNIQRESINIELFNESGISNYIYY